MQSTPPSPAGPASPRGVRLSVQTMSRPVELSKTEAAHQKSLEYELPELVDSIRQGRISTHTLSAIVTSLFSVMEVVFLTATNPSTTLSGVRAVSGRTKNFFLVASYGALIFNISSTISCLYLTDLLGAMAFEQKEIPQHTPRTSRRLLQAFGAKGRMYVPVEWHWYLSFYLGIISVFCQFGTYVWLHETSVVAIVTTVATAYASLPLFFLFF